MRSAWVFTASCLAVACGSSAAKPPDMMTGSLGAPPLPTTANDPSVPDVAPKDLGPLEPGNCDPHQFLASAGNQCSMLKTKYAEATGGAGKNAAASSDQDACTVWSSGGMPPAYVLIDLGSDQMVSGILLVPEVTPPDVEMSNVIEIADSKGSLHAIAELKGHILDEHGILAPLPKPVVARYLRLTTLGSPAWVAWREVSALHCAL
jgi:hypothetical protein